MRLGPDQDSLRFVSRRPDSPSDVESNQSDPSCITRSVVSVLQSRPAIEEVTEVPRPVLCLGRAKDVSLERAIEVLDTLRSSVSSLNSNYGFISSMGSKRKIHMLAFEVANTIVKGANLLQSLSEENVQLLRTQIFPSEGVQKLVSTDMNELLNIAATDLREEYEVFLREIIRFGDMCKDPQWNHLNRYFVKLGSVPITHKQGRREVEREIRALNTLAQHTSDYYYELHALERLEQGYQQKLEEVDSLNIPLTGTSLKKLRRQINGQRKLMRSLKKKSLWSKDLEEVMEKLCDIVTFIRQEIMEIFGDPAFSGVEPQGEPINNVLRLSIAGLALNYANIVKQIVHVASTPTCLDSNMRDTLYHALPTSVKTALRSRLQSVDAKEELTIPQIKSEMQKTLKWLVPVAANTIKAHQCFGWVVEWANTSTTEFGDENPKQNNVIRLETLYHADKQKADLCILEMVTWLRRLISLVKRDKPMPIQSPIAQALVPSPGINIILSPDHSFKTLYKIIDGASEIWPFSRSTRNVLDMMDGLDSSV